MASSISPPLLLLLLLLLLVLPSSIDAVEVSRSTYIIRVQNDLKPSIFPTAESWYSSTLRSLATSSSNSVDSRASASFLHVYRTVFHGFSAVLTAVEADLLSTNPAVVALMPERVHRLHTTRTPLFLGLVATNAQPNSLLNASDYGSRTVIAILDSGIRPDHRSFQDRGLGPPPPHWKGRCEGGASFAAASCNRKLVGARFFTLGFDAAAKSGAANASADIRSPFDSDGHGTHTAATAAGRRAANASLFGYASGVAAGVAPGARIAAYKVCWSSGCFDSDILAAFDEAVEDGADVVSLSIGTGPAPYHLDPIAVAAFSAAERGVLVVTSAGNDGPSGMTVTNIAPWMVTVGAGTIDRRFPADVVLGSGGAYAGSVFVGASLYAGPRDPLDRKFPLVSAANVSSSDLGFRTGAPFCMRGSLDPAAAHGKVVLCERGAVPRVEKGLAVKEAGGAGMIVANQASDREGLVPDAHLLPAAAVGETAGYAIRAYIATSPDPRVRFVFRGTVVGVRPAPMLASFSARGPNAESAYVLKPDVVAPGVGILAAWPDDVAPTGMAADERRTEFNIMSGTSMACPHVSGLAALLRAVHPDWSPASIKSAMMTTAYGQDMLDESTGNRSTGFGVGAGHVYPEKAVNPGLVYDLTPDDYIAFMCGSNYTQKDVRTIARRPVSCARVAAQPWDLNYPSISVVFEQSLAPTEHEVTVRRTVTNVGEGASVYTVSVTQPEGAAVAVEPEKLVFERKGEKLGFVVRISAGSVGLGAGDSKTAFGSLSWGDGKHLAKSPMAVTWQQPF